MTFLSLTFLCLCLALSVSAVTREQRILENQKSLFSATIDCSPQNQNLWQEFNSIVNPPRPTHDVVLTAPEGVKLCAHSGFLVAQSEYFANKIKKARKDVGALLFISRLPQRG
jgi:hypothetical protein